MTYFNLILTDDNFVSSLQGFDTDWVKGGSFACKNLHQQSTEVYFPNRYRKKIKEHATDQGSLENGVCLCSWDSLCYFLLCFILFTSDGILHC